MGKTQAKPIASAVLEAIKAGHGTAKAIGNEPRCKAAIKAEAAKTGRDEMRILDGALQHLRRTGLTEFKQGAWHSKHSLDL